MDSMDGQKLYDFMFINLKSGYIYIEWCSEIGVRRLVLSSSTYIFLFISDNSFLGLFTFE